MTAMISPTMVRVFDHLAWPFNSLR